MGYSLPDSSVHGISQERILKWVAIFFSRGSSRPRDQTCVSCIAGRSLTTGPPGKPIPLSSVKYIPTVMKTISRTFSSYKTIPIRQQLPISPSQAPGSQHSALCLYEFSIPLVFKPHFTRQHQSNKFSIKIQTFWKCIKVENQVVPIPNPVTQR